MYSSCKLTSGIIQHPQAGEEMVMTRTSKVRVHGGCFFLMDYHKSKNFASSHQCQHEWRIWPQGSVCSNLESNSWAKKPKLLSLTLGFVYCNLPGVSKWFHHHLRKLFHSQEQNHICLYWYMLTSSKTCVCPHLRQVFLMSLCERVYYSNHIDTGKQAPVYTFTCTSFGD